MFSRIRQKIHTVQQHLYLQNAYKHFNETLSINFENFVPHLQLKRGYRDGISLLKNIYRGKRCFIIGGGPSLNFMNLSPLNDEITIGLNGIFKLREKFGIKLDYLLAEDEHVVKSYAKELKDTKEILKLFALHNAKHLGKIENALFYNTNYPADEIYWKEGQEFSKNFNHIAYLGGTITYIALQFAFFLGCEKVYLLGIDFDYGPLFMEKFHEKQGKTIDVNTEILEILRLCYPEKGYVSLKIGDKLNIPHWDIQKQSFELAKKSFEYSNREILNAGINSKLDTFKMVDFKSLFPPSF